MKTSPLFTSPIKMERIKRSWTQEHLSEVTGLSVRTIQRIENGEGINAESMRLIAEAMNISPDTLKATSIRVNFRSPWSMSLKVSTTMILLVLLISGIISLQMSPWILQGLVGLVLLCLAFSVQGYSLKEGKLLIHRIGWSTRYPLNEICGVEVNSNATMGSIRVFGIGGMFANVGFFRNDILENYRAYITDPNNAIILRLQNRTIVITPDDALGMKSAIEHLLEGTRQNS